ncbi:hypothetical protein [Paractinoplanes maris]|uniref:hypothetical protein n=1 Tax=Paractinoplanes maris TaxID=1734446 RepID=UPI0020224D6A|nr:hypothetical protein [Actinoplanes maris]
MSDSRTASVTAGTPAGRAGTPHEVAWIVSDRAAYPHGAEVAVDGGITATKLF